MKKRILSLLTALSLILSSATALFACGDDENEGGKAPAEHSHKFAEKWTYDSLSHWHPAECEHSTERGSEGPHMYENGKCKVCERPEDSDGKTSYTVKVTDGSGNPCQGMIVEFVRNSETVSVTFTDEDGFARARLNTEIYTVKVAPAGGGEIYYDEEIAFVSADEPDLEITVYSLLSEKTDVMVEGGGTGDDTAYLVSEGRFRIAFSNETMTYFVFTAQRSGIFEIKVDADTTVEVGYYGISSYVRTTDQTLDEDRVDRATIKIDVAPSNLAAGDERPATPYVIGVKAKLKSGAGILSITRVGDHETEITDLPWNTYGVDVNPELYAPTEATLPGYTLVDFDLTDKSLKIVKSEADGYYHYMTEDGPLVLMKIDLPSLYLDPISAMCGPQHFGAPIYDGEGNFVKKETYHEMTLRYVAASLVSEGGNGTCPLDDHLITMIKNLGEAWGWYDLTANSPTQIFGDRYADIVQENAWMFALCYAEMREAEHKITVTADAPVEGVTVSVRNSAGETIAEGVTDAEGSVNLTFVHSEGLTVFLSGEALWDYSASSEGYPLDKAVITITVS